MVGNGDSRRSPQNDRNHRRFLCGWHCRPPRWHPKRQKRRRFICGSTFRKGTDIKNDQKRRLATLFHGWAPSAPPHIWRETLHSMGISDFRVWSTNKKIGPRPFWCGPPTCSHFLCPRSSRHALAADCCFLLGFRATDYWSKSKMCENVDGAHPFPEERCVPPASPAPGGLVS